MNKPAAEKYVQIGVSFSDVSYSFESRISRFVFDLLRNESQRFRHLRGSKTDNPVVTPGINRRKHIRVPVTAQDIKVLYQKDGVPFEAIPLDISVGGLALRVKASDKLSIGDELRIQIKGQQWDLWVQCRVAYVR